MTETLREILGEVSTWLKLLALVVLAAEGVILSAMRLTPSDKPIHSWYPVLMLLFLAVIVVGVFFERYLQSKRPAPDADAPHHSAGLHTEVVAGLKPSSNRLTDGSHVAALSPRLVYLLRHLDDKPHGHYTMQETFAIVLASYDKSDKKAWECAVRYAFRYLGAVGYVEPQVPGHPISGARVGISETGREALASTELRTKYAESFAKKLVRVS